VKGYCDAHVGRRRGGECTKLRACGVKKTRLDVWAGMKHETKVTKKGLESGEHRSNLDPCILPSVGMNIREAKVGGCKADSVRARGTGGGKGGKARKRRQHTLVGENSMGGGDGKGPPMASLLETITFLG